MRFRTPRPSMNAITCACAPAPIETIDDGHRVRPHPHLYRLRLEARRRAHVDRRLSRYVEDSCSRDVLRVLEHRTRNRERGADAGAHAGNTSQDVEGDVETPGAGGVEDLPGRDAADGPDGALQMR